MRVLQGAVLFFLAIVTVNEFGLAKRMGCVERRAKHDGNHFASSFLYVYEQEESHDRRIDRQSAEIVVLKRKIEELELRLLHETHRVVHVRAVVEELRQREYWGRK